MRKFTALLSLALLTVGCSSKETPSTEVAAEAEQTEAPAVPADQLPEAPRESAVTPAAQPAPVEGEITLEGDIGCCRCTFKTGSECAGALRAADGVVYLLEGVAQESELFSGSKSGKKPRVVGVPREEDGVHYLAVTSFEI